MTRAGVEILPGLCRSLLVYVGGVRVGVFDRFGGEIWW